MIKVVRWKIWYDDGETYCSDDGPAEEAPIDGIQMILERKENNTLNHHYGHDYYMWTGENWVAGHIGSLEKWIRKVLPQVKYGRWTKDSIYTKAMEEARKGDGWL